MTTCRPRTARPTPGLAGTLALAALAVFTALLVAAPARAEAPQFLAEVDPNPVAAGDTFIYSVTMSTGGEAVEDFHAPDFKGLRVVGRSGPNQSTQMQIGGGGTFIQNSTTWRFQIEAPSKGNVTIGPARARVGGQDYKSNVVTVTVGSAGAPPPGNGARGGGRQSGGGTDPFGFPNFPGMPGMPGFPGLDDDDDNQPPAATSTNAAATFIRVVVDKQKAYVGEPIAVGFYLYLSEPLDKYETLTEPRMEGFWSEDVAVPTRHGGGMILNQQTLNGHTYSVGTLFKKVLYPLHAGTLTITPMEAEVAKVGFFGTVARRQRLTSTAQNIEVLPLPQAGQPAGFDPANVGTFTLNASVDRDTVAVGEAVTLKLVLSGSGNLRKITLPVVPALDGWKAYEPQITVDVDGSTGVGGSKTAEILVLPQRPGQVTVPALGLDVFDPSERRYVHLATQPIALSATGDAGAVAGTPTATPGAGTTPAPAGGAPTPAGAGTENVLAAEIRPIHAQPRLTRNLGATFYRSGLFFGIVALPPLGLALASLLLSWRDRRAEDTHGARLRQSKKIVSAHLSAAERFKARGEVAPFFIEIDRVLREVLSTRLGQPVKGLRLDELSALLTTRGLPAADAARVVAALEECDHARFAGGASSSAATETMRRAFEGAVALIELLQRARSSRAPEASS